MLVSYKKEELGTTCFYNIYIYIYIYIYHGLETKADLANYFNQKNGRTQAEKGEEKQREKEHKKRRKTQGRQRVRKMQ
jgi:hypothetical protein